MSQKFYANPRDTFTWPNGAVGFRSGSTIMVDYLGPYAKVKNCPIAGTDLRYTCYASGYADTYFSVPANTRIRGQHVRGYFSLDGGDIEFRVMDSHKHIIKEELDTKLAQKIVEAEST